MSFEQDLLEQSVPVKSIPLYRISHNNSFYTPGRHRTTAEAHRYGALVFLSNFGETESTSGLFYYDEKPYFLSNHTVVLINASCSFPNNVIFNTSKVMLGDSKGSDKRNDTTNPKTIPITGWKYYKEEVGYGVVVDSTERKSPEQLNITNNESDFLWYSFHTNVSGQIAVNLYGWGGLHYVYVDGALTNRIPRETKLMTTNRRKLSTSEHKIDVLSVAMGLSNADVSPNSSKGLKNVTIGPEKDSITMFSTAWKLKGEDLEIYTEEGSKHVVWHPLSSKEDDAVNRGLVWLQGRFDMPKDLRRFVGGSQPNQTSLVANLSGLNKGVAYVNGFHIGRYWLLNGTCNGNCAPPHHGKHCYLHWKNCNQPTQRLYHIPFEVLKEEDNIITVFEETAPAIPNTLDQVWLEILHDHP